VASEPVLSDRFSQWLLPESQACTFRIALWIVKATIMLEPTMGLSYNVPFHPWQGWRARLVWWRFNSRSAQAALGELEADMCAEERVLHPVRLVLPLLIDALKWRLRNGGTRTRALILGCRGSALYWKLVLKMSGPNPIKLVHTAYHLASGSLRRSQPPPDE
jgi:hypothetical protein